MKLDNIKVLKMMAGDLIVGVHVEQNNLEKHMINNPHMIGFDQQGTMKLIPYFPIFESNVIPFNADCTEVISEANEAVKGLYLQATKPKSGLIMPEQGLYMP